MNPLRRARFRTAATLRSARNGTARTASWVKDGVTGSASKAGGKISGLVRRDSDPKPEPALSTSEGDSEPGFFGGVIESARSDRKVGAAWIAAGVLILLWIAWAVYVTAEHGANAGLGVVISWPAVVAALAIVAAPFIGAFLLVRRLQSATPALAGGPAIGGEEAATEQETKDESADDESKDDEDESDDDESGDADDSEEDAEGDASEDSDDDSNDNEPGDEADESEEDAA